MKSGESITEKLDYTKMPEETRNLLLKMENYMQKIMQKELRAFDEYIEEKLKHYDDHLIDYEEVHLLRKKFYDRIRKRMLNILEDAFNNDNKEMQQYFMDRLSSNIGSDESELIQAEIYESKHAPKDAILIEPPGLTEAQHCCLEKKGNQLAKHIESLIDEDHDPRFQENPMLGPYEEEIENFKAIYEGQYNKGMKSGLGRLILDNHTYVEGEFKKDRPNGYQRLIGPDANSFEGEIFSDGKYENTMIRGVLSSPESEELEESRKRGIGVAYYKYGCRYEGAFLDGLRHGYGEFYDVDGGVFKGFWLDDEMHGEGFYIDHEGCLYKQVWKKGELVEKSKVMNKG